jgi:uncharacterized membrane protein
MKKKTLQALLALGVMVVGVYMLYTNVWPTMPAVSGLGFLMAGFALWVPYCPMCKKICK